MPFVFLIVGIGMLVVAVRGTQQTAFALLQSEFSGPNSFTRWALAIFIIGTIGYVPSIRPATRALLVLVMLVIVLKNGTGLFSKFNQQIANPTPPDTGSGTPVTAPGVNAGVTQDTTSSLFNNYNPFTSTGNSTLAPMPGLIQIPGFGTPGSGGY